MRRNDNMLLRIAQGDAFGMSAEYAVRHPDEPEHKELFEFKRYLPHPSYHKLPPGTYTDDAQMSIAMAEYLIHVAMAGSVTQKGCIQHWFDTFKRDPRDGYSRGFQLLLELATSPEELRKSLRPDSTKNGAAMRSVPLGVIGHLDYMKYVASVQAATTHNTKEGIWSSVAVALMSHFALHDPREFSDMLEWCLQHCPVFEHFREPWVGPVQSRCAHSPYDVGVNTAWAVHTLLTEETTLLGIMKRLLEWGGDTDSVAAVAWGIASCRMTEELPSFFEDDLERLNACPYGPAFLKDLGKRLMEAYA